VENIQVIKLQVIKLLRRTQRSAFVHPFSYVEVSLQVFWSQLGSLRKIPKRT